jgi:hypothetical protein
MLEPDAFSPARQMDHEPTVAISGQKLHLFQMDWRMDKIARRNANCGNKRLFGLTYH